MKQLYTIGYGGRTPQQLINLLHEHQIVHVVDVRLRPDRASMGFYKLAKEPEKGIQGLFNREGIQYHSRIELGNLFVDHGEAYRTPYTLLLEKSGELLTESLRSLLDSEDNVCLLCAEKDPKRCHRTEITDYLVRIFQTKICHLP